MADEPAKVTHQERVDFLKQSMAFNEGNVRAYDVKAQISLAAFVLSGNPIIGIINGSCGASSRQVLVATLVIFIPTVLSYLWVLWPVAPRQQELTGGTGAKNLFYLHAPLTTDGNRYSEQLKDLVVEPELTAELLKLSFIRKVKAKRFKSALIATISAYLLIVAAYFALGRCVF